MYQISNTDYEQVLRLLRAFSLTTGKSLREQNQRRMAALLRCKLERKKEDKMEKDYRPFDVVIYKPTGEC